MKKLRVVVISLLVLVLLLGVAVAANAVDPQPTAVGSLTTTGDGVVGLTGKGAAQINATGSGVIWVTKGELTTTGSGERFDIPGRGTLLVSWNGAVTVKGEPYTLRIVSHSVDLSATGQGVANLMGRGAWEKGDGESGEWSATGVKVVFGRPRVIQGTGALSASGAGSAVVKGDGRVEIQGHGQGVIRIKNATSLQIEGEVNAAVAANATAQATPGANTKKGATLSGGAQRVDLPDGTVVLRNFAGKVTAEGKDMQIGMRSAQIEFRATGTGIVLLRGTGHYQVGALSGDWTAAGIAIQIKP
jgi:hypothetical protein